MVSKRSSCQHKRSTNKEVHVNTALREPAIQGAGAYQRAGSASGAHTNLRDSLSCHSIEVEDLPTTVAQILLALRIHKGRTACLSHSSSLSLLPQFPLAQGPDPHQDLHDTPTQRWLQFC